MNLIPLTQRKSATTDRGSIPAGTRRRSPGPLLRSRLRARQTRGGSGVTIRASLSGF
jgi:hypothetical protein